MSELSPEAQQAKTATENGMRAAIAKKVLENWNTLYPDRNAHPPTNENVMKEVDKLTADSIGPDGKPKKYNEKFGELIPTQATIAEFGNASARAAENGKNAQEHAGGQDGGWLGGLISGILSIIPDSWLKGLMGMMGMSPEEIEKANMSTVRSAIGQWAAGGFSGSVKEKYAEITANDIKGEFNRELDQMSQDPEHKQFIEKNNVRAIADTQITQSVNAAAGLTAAAAASSLESQIDGMERPAAPKIEALDPSKITGNTKEERIGSVIDNVIVQTKTPKLQEALDKLSDEQKQEVARLEASLKKNAIAVATGNPPPADNKAFADAALVATLRENGLITDPSITTVEQAQESMRKQDDGKNQMEEKALLVGAFASTLGSSYGMVRTLAQGGELTPEAIERGRQEAAAGNVEATRRIAADSEKKLTDTIRQNLSESIMVAAADGVINKGWPATGTFPWSQNSGPTNTINELSPPIKDADKMSPEQLAVAQQQRAEREKQLSPDDQNRLRQARQTLYDYAHTGSGTVNGGSRVPDGKQTDVIGEVVSKTMTETLKDPRTKGMSKEQLADLVRNNTLQALKENELRINAAGRYTVGQINEKSEIDLFAQVADGVSNNIRHNVPDAAGNGTYDQLVTARGIIVDAPIKALADRDALTNTNTPLASSNVTDAPPPSITANANRTNSTGVGVAGS